MTKKRIQVVLGLQHMTFQVYDAHSLVWEMHIRCSNVLSEGYWGTMGRQLPLYSAYPAYSSDVCNQTSYEL